LQKESQFLAKSPFTMMLLLIFDVATHLIDTGGTHGKGGVTFLPGKVALIQFIMDPNR